MDAPPRHPGSLLDVGERERRGGGAGRRRERQRELPLQARDEAVDGLAPRRAEEVDRDERVEQLAEARERGDARGAGVVG